jgi:hypothetical protein
MMKWEREKGWLEEKRDHSNKPSDLRRDASPNSSMKSIAKASIGRNLKGSGLPNPPSLGKESGLEMTILGEGADAWERP